MDALTRFGLEKGRLTIPAIIGLLIMGVTIYTQLPKRKNPAISIERNAREISKIENISTLTTIGSVMVNLNLYESGPSGEQQTVFQDIHNKMDEVRLPEGTEGPNVYTNCGDVSIATISITGEGFDPREVWDVADAQRKDLYAMDGIPKFGRCWCATETSDRRLGSPACHLVHR